MPADIGSWGYNINRHGTSPHSTCGHSGKSMAVSQKSEKLETEYQPPSEEQLDRVARNIHRCLTAMEEKGTAGLERELDRIYPPNRETQEALSPPTLQSEIHREMTAEGPVEIHYTLSDVPVKTVNRKPKLA